ncbi:hypothetical protein E4L95_13265 [Paracoccus liaowanqingii]|uniref:Transferrin-binding protein B C-lobe/N-lobe beta barrel domain-containing protein n=1 Tax=Paracoccus liaowanqingii TaxID=2560053 RepID=A0A4Z1C246_9RHOB|nr:hypothetical protein [Paracoccus liaowanqingii]TGN57502.1 hypothetical protein E4L95_13265 [Paracoccus liaowanqingii]
MLTRTSSLSAIASVVALLTACTDTGVEKNFSRSEEYTRLMSEADFTETSNLSDLSGMATYQGVAKADFGSFSGTADARITADFSEDKLSGSMTNWVDDDPLNYDLNGKVELSNGSIDPHAGTFATDMFGNIERSPVGMVDPANPPVAVWIAGNAEGSFHNSLDGDHASHVVGVMEGETSGAGGVISGDFVAAR